MKIPRSALRALWLLAIGLAWQPWAWAQPAAAASAPAAAAAAASAPEAAASEPARPMPRPDQYSSRGADTCLGCHEDETATYSAAAIFKAKHGAPTDARSPFGPKGLQCEACHGPGALHARNNRRSAINHFKADSKVPLAERNAICLNCHQGTSRTGWHASTHERNAVACTDCHKIHRPQGDPMLVRSNEAAVCLSCHKNQAADFHKPSAHPVRQGLMSCSGCHSPHGSTAQAMLAKPTLNQTCFSCHADKRGPMLWEHQPVTEDCSLCHTPHGSVRPALLAKSPPLLCQQCHSPAGHPSVARTPGSLPANGGSGAIYTAAGSCTSCHVQVHGSNHPSGAKLMR